MCDVDISPLPDVYTSVVASRMCCERSGNSGAAEGQDAAEAMWPALRSGHHQQPDAKAGRVSATPPRPELAGIHVVPAIGIKLFMADECKFAGSRRAGCQVGY